MDRPNRLTLSHSRFCNSSEQGLLGSESQSKLLDLQLSPNIFLLTVCDIQAFFFGLSLTNSCLVDLIDDDPDV